MGYQTPSDSFNLVYLLVHLHHHFLYEGVGFRQLMDYYMLLKSIPTNVRPIYYRNAIQTLDSFGMVGFTEGVMYLMNTLFNVSNDALLCMPNKDIGDMLLADHVGKRQYG